MKFFIVVVLVLTVLIVVLVMKGVMRRRACTTRANEDIGETIALLTESSPVSPVPVPPAKTPTMNRNKKTKSRHVLVSIRIYERRVQRYRRYGGQRKQCVVRGPYIGRTSVEASRSQSKTAVVDVARAKAYQVAREAGFGGRIIVRLGLAW